MTVSAISVSDMHCADCAAKIQRALADVTGIAATHINPARRQVLIEHAEDASASEFLSRIEQAGFHGTLQHAPDQSKAQRDLLKRIGIAGLAMMQVMMAALALYVGDHQGMEPGFRRLLEWTSLVFCIPVVGYAARPFFSSAFRALASGLNLSGLNMDVPIALAIATAFVVSLVNTLSHSGEIYYDSVVMFTFLLLIARYVDDRLKRNFESSAASLAALPAYGCRFEQGERVRRALNELRVGDRLWIGEGEQIPMDGYVGEYETYLDESVLSGESSAVRKSRGDLVFAGTLNCGTGFGMTASKAVDRSRIADIASLADRAGASRPPVAQFADRIARVFIPMILLFAALTWLGWQWFDPARAFVAALTVLVVSCPCALSLATPAAVTAAMTRLRQVGVVLTRSDLLEQIPRLSLALVDKTGTLTLHEPRITRIEPVRTGFDQTFDQTFDKDSGLESDMKQALGIAAALQRHSSHPYAKAFLSGQITKRERQRYEKALSHVQSVPGAGVRGIFENQEVTVGHAGFAGIKETDDPAIYLSIDRVPVARFVIEDQLRSDAAKAIKALAVRGLKPIMVSGDAEDRCADLAQRLDIKYSARQAPQSKLAMLQAAQQSGETVLVVGDGINDIPVLAAADVSVAVLESNDLVKSRADVLLLTRRLGALVDLIDIGRRAQRTIRQNLGWALAYNLCAIPVAALGYMPPWVAALGMASSSTLVMLNAARLLRVASFTPVRE